MTSRRSSGFTLVELMTALVMSSLLVLAAVALVNNQQRSYQNGMADRALQEAGRVAMEAVADPLRQAGYGLDPQYVIDLGAMPDVPQQGMPQGVRAAFASVGGCVSPDCRDRVDQSDELVFYERNPMFSRPIVGATTASIRVRGDLTRSLLPGQVLQAMCTGGDQRRAYVTVGSRIDPPSPADPNAVVTIQLSPGRVVGVNPQFPFQNDLLVQGGNRDDCFNSGTAVLAQIDRYRFFVTSFTEDGTETLVGVPRSRPYLMLDQGLTDATGPVLTPVASDVEDLQVAYFFLPLVANGPNQLVGATVNTPATAQGLTVANPPAIDTPFADPLRTAFHPMNLLALRISMVVRAPFADANDASTAGLHSLPAAGNRPQIDRPDHIRRLLFEVSVPLPNLQTVNVPYCVIGVGPGMQAGGC